MVPPVRQFFFDFLKNRPCCIVLLIIIFFLVYNLKKNIEKNNVNDDIKKDIKDCKQLKDILILYNIDLDNYEFLYELSSYVKIYKIDTYWIGKLYDEVFEKLSSVVFSTGFISSLFKNFYNYQYKPNNTLEKIMGTLDIISLVILLTVFLFFLVCDLLSNDLYIYKRMIKEIDELKLNYLFNFK